MPGLTHQVLEGFYQGLPPQLARHRERLGEIAPGYMISGHVFHSEQWADFLAEFGLKHIFIYRDPRDVAVSLAYFYTHILPDHVGFRHLGQCLHTEADRIRAVITGFTHDGLAIPTIDEYCRRFLPWRDHPTTLVLTFEDLMRSPESQRAALRRVVRHVLGSDLDWEAEDEVITAMQSKNDPAASRTFRRGEIGSWRKDLDPVAKTLFKALAGDLVIELGYESDPDW